jgi:predicted acetyltransferase
MPTLKMPINALAPLITGHLSAPALRAIGALAGDEEAVAIAAALFTTSPPWMADRF